MGPIAEVRTRPRCKNCRYFTVFKDNRHSGVCHRLGIDLLLREDLRFDEDLVQAGILQADVCINPGSTVNDNQPDSQVLHVRVLEGFGCVRHEFANRIECLHCGDVISSSEPHQFVRCSCGKCGVDGGLEYFDGRRIGIPDEDYIDYDDL